MTRWQRISTILLPLVLVAGVAAEAIRRSPGEWPREFALVSAAIALIAIAAVRRHFRGQQEGRSNAFDPLEAPLLWWTKEDCLSVREFLGSVLIMSRSGGGKSTGSGRTLLRCIVEHAGSAGPRSGGLTLGAKPEELEDARKIFAAAGRQDDLIVIAPGGDKRLNVLEYVAKIGGDEREIVRCLMNINQAIRNGGEGGGGGGENEEFFAREQDRQLLNAVVILRLTTGGVSAPDLQRFIGGAARSPEELSDPTWRAGWHSKLIDAAFNAPKTPIEAQNCELAFEYWLRELPKMADRTRSSIEAGVMGLLHVLNSGHVHSLLSRDTTASPDDVLAGKWLFVDMSPSEYGDSGACVGAAFKYVLERRILRREFKPGDPFVVIWLDEAHQTVNSYDALYLSQCRSHGGCMVHLTQAVHSYYGAMKGRTGRSQADALLANFLIKIFHAAGDSSTAEFASRLVGNRLAHHFGGSTAPPEDVFDEFYGKSRFTGSVSEHLEPILEPNVFLNGLRTGGKRNGMLVDGIVIKSGEPFSNGENWLRATFSQV